MTQPGAPIYRRPTATKPIQPPTPPPRGPGDGNNQPAQVKPKPVVQPTETLWLERQLQRGAKLDFYFLTGDVLEEAVIVEFCRYALIVRGADGEEQQVFKHRLQRICPAAGTKE